MRTVIEKAVVTDAAEILSLQKIAYLSEAEIYEDYSIEPLVQTIESLEQQFNNHIVLKAIIDNILIGSVRACVENETTYVGKLMVHPNFQRLGIGTLLMKDVEKHCVTNRYELFTGSKSVNNIRLYEILGYRVFDRKMFDDKLGLVWMEKILGGDPHS